MTLRKFGCVFIRCCITAMGAALVPSNDTNQFLTFEGKSLKFSNRKHKSMTFSRVSNNVIVDHFGSERTHLSGSVTYLCLRAQCALLSD